MSSYLGPRESFWECEDSLECHQVVREVANYREAFTKAQAHYRETGHITRATEQRTHVFFDNGKEAKR